MRSSESGDTCCMESDMSKHHQIEKILKRLQDECISIPNAYVIEKLRQILKEEL